MPLYWRFRKEKSGSGSLGDILSHSLDLGRFVLGSEVTEVAGALETFVKRRPLPENPEKKGRVTVDDAALSLVRFANGAVGSIEGTRFATGRKNYNRFEVNGSRGSVAFNMERMNELEYYDARLPRAVQGWTTIMCTHGGDHPYVANWWPDAHLIGYEHGFVNQAYDICRVLGGQEPTVPIPDFNDAYQTQRVLEAALLAAAERRAVKMDEVK